MVVRLLFVISIVIYIESNLTLSCVIKSKQNKMYVSNSFKKYDGYKALKILEVILIPNIQKDYCSGFTKNIRCINCYNPALIITHLKFENYHYCMIVRVKVLIM